LFDTYFALLERPELRQLGAMKYQIRHRTPLFSRAIYENSSGIVFGSEAQAYQHWLDRGRRQGHEWAQGKDTLLKIILKAKDESYLIDSWISHHAAIVGYENLIIMDCGSRDPTYLEKLRFYAPKVLILDYRRYYDHLHSTHSNHDFFNLVGMNCKYVTILDADEFLFARRGDLFSSQLVKQVLREQDRKLFCGMWVDAVGGSEPDPDGGHCSSVCTLDISTASLLGGAVAGKSVARSDIIFDLGHLGHNLHVPEAFQFVSEEAFGSIFVLHMKNFSPDRMKKRILKHLVAKGAVAEQDEMDVEEQIRTLLDAVDTAPPIKGYGQSYLECGQATIAPSGEDFILADIVDSRAIQCLTALEHALASLDVPKMIQDQHDLVLGAR
jgi:hypothetical protein